MVQGAGSRDMGFGSWSWGLAFWAEGFGVSLVMWVRGSPLERTHWLVLYMWHQVI
jgi:hypothetical protein